MKYSNEQLITSVKRGDKPSASLVVSLIENGSPEGEECLGGLAIKTERSCVLGLLVGREWGKAL